MEGVGGLQILKCAKCSTGAIAAAPVTVVAAKHVALVFLHLSLSIASDHFLAASRGSDQLFLVLEAVAVKPLLELHSSVAVCRAVPPC